MVVEVFRMVSAVVTEVFPIALEATIAVSRIVFVAIIEVSQIGSVATAGGSRTVLGVVIEVFRTALAVVTEDLVAVAQVEDVVNSELISR